ncbi:MAG TPA: NAD(P)/FAD-dependent oxidoreductase [Actinomycetota bacterium]|nr:NAD(P)/FAD-dependent oxidoreductase [Actinomycetota bacterium]
MRVCVVGAGFAGLAAAAALADGGVEPLVLEARERVGGRVHSRRLRNGAVVELGAEFVERDQRAVVAAAGRLGLELVPTGMAYGDREPRGGIGVDRATLHAELDRLRRLLAERPGPPAGGRSAADVLAGLPLHPGAREAIAARLQVSAAQPVEQLAAAVLDHAGSTFSTRESIRVGGGNQRIAERLAARLPGAVHLGVPVEAVAWSEGSVRVTAAGGVLDADALLLAVPASVTGRVRFDPPLPAWTAEALGRVTYGHAAKLFVPLRRVPPPSAVLSVPDHFWTWTARGDQAGAVQPLVSAFAGSAPALARLGVAAGPATWLGRLRALRPDLDLEEAGAVLSTWDDDPWVGAAYSTRGLAFDPADAEPLARPVGPLHFAGEHTAGPWAGLMEGALRSGARAAAELLGPDGPVGRAAYDDAP